MKPPLVMLIVPKYSESLSQHAIVFGEGIISASVTGDSVDCVVLAEVDSVVTTSVVVVSDVLN